jgi:hypothetical protein
MACAYSQVQAVGSKRRTAPTSSDSIRQLTIAPLSARDPRMNEGVAATSVAQVQYARFSCSKGKHN